MTPSLRIASEADTARVEYVAVTARGAPIKKFEDRRRAVAFAAECCASERFPGATVREVTYPAPICRTVWRERNLRLVESA